MGLNGHSWSHTADGWIDGWICPAGCAPNPSSSDFIHERSERRKKKAVPKSGPHGAQIGSEGQWTPTLIRATCCCCFCCCWRKGINGTQEDMHQRGRGEGKNYLDATRLHGETIQPSACFTFFFFFICLFTCPPDLQLRPSSGDYLQIQGPCQATKMCTINREIRIDRSTAGGMGLRTHWAPGRGGYIGERTCT
ncbi:hypothetical protein BC939DRAFT_332986 [Gamsiella multidivaricata]|uniref:uncharacterized protein n=1 Tax=Gamsiella multidivaricata TaxID=101098 RepID=UPI002220C57F|nr:uncharacterized protein BC939DRAFT_332986 [Gamsiella multidivaricata]KAI7817303.1 hypothetical protein BC939DRAFT_332986 [Gamsiella multidivaricata]